jgi:hypothetical protein
MPTAYKDRERGAGRRDAQIWLNHRFCFKGGLRASTQRTPDTPPDRVRFVGLNAAEPNP